jgi:hypothetical protein
LRAVVAHGMLRRMPEADERSLDAHPGLIGPTSQGVIAIHANWPMYPWEHGWLMALINLCCFPARTTFTEIDDIDRVLLLSAEELAPHDAGNDLFSPKRFHAAIWHTDLIELARLGYVTGVEDDDEDELGSSNRADCVLLPDKTLTVTPDGAAPCDQALARHFEVPKVLRARVRPIVDAKLYEAAIRETSVQLEIAMRNGIGARRHSGRNLIERYCEYIERNTGVLPSVIKSLRGDLRLTFRFVRNEYIHENPDPPRVRALALLFRLCSLYSEITELTPGGEPEAT